MYNLNEASVKHFDAFDQLILQVYAKMPKKWYLSQNDLLNYSSGEAS